MKYGEIWYINFLESIGHEQGKDRPALIVQSDQQLKITNIITVIPLTSNIKNKHNDDIIIIKDDTNNLFYDSALKVHHIKSFDESRFIKRIGAVEVRVLEEVKAYLKKHFSL